MWCRKGPGRAAVLSESLTAGRLRRPFHEFHPDRRPGAARRPAVAAQVDDVPAAADPAPARRTLPHPAHVQLGAKPRTLDGRLLMLCGEPRTRYSIPPAAERTVGPAFCDNQPSRGCVKP